MKKPVKTGVKRGDGPPPGYRWTVRILDLAFVEAMPFLSAAQYEHIAQQVRELAREHDPSHSETQSVREVSDFLELRDKGGILGKKNVRVFFFLHQPTRELVILGAINKNSENQLPAGDRIRISRRRRKYLEGAYG